MGAKWRVQHRLETFLARAAESDPLGYGVPARVERDFRAYLRRGILAHGFARARCDDCGHERLIAFSCKGRGICPSCNTRRMAEVAAHLTEHVLPHLPVRQSVLSLPERLHPRPCATGAKSPGWCVRWIAQSLMAPPRRPAAPGLDPAGPGGRRQV